jgi:ABC-type lipoprotein export system ATPase subunit
VMAVLRNLASDHARAIVIVTHDNRISAYADRVVRIEDGRIAGAADRRKAQLFLATDAATAPDTIAPHVPQRRYR